MPSKTSFSCGEFLDISHAAKLYDRLKKAMDKSSTIEIKAEKVVKADTAGLQMMLIASREVANADGRLIWKNPSQELLTVAGQLGVAKCLGLTE